MSHADHEKNRIAWNEMVNLHIDHPEYKTKEVIEGGSSLKQLELKAMGDVRGKKLLHLMCQFGLDTLSWVREGAIVTGVDISDRSIEVADEIKAKAGLTADFVRSDILELPASLNGQFDIVYQSYGTHCWISDVEAWTRVVARVLKPGGMFFIVDEHPINVLFLLDPPINYFRSGPLRDPRPTDYCVKDHHIGSELVEWQHSLSSIINALIKAGMVIDEVGEYDYGYYRVEKDWYQDGEKWYPPGGPTNYPLMMSIKAHKK
jgi:ubiquinone/menaquinone biosynthesis C-methylase UbiE